MSTETIIVETTRPRRRHPPQPPAGAERAQRRADGRADRRGRRLRGRRRHRLHADHRLGQGVRRRRRHQGDGGQVLSSTSSCDDFAARLGAARARAQAGDRGGGRLRARRRLRARDDVRLHHRRRQRQVRPAGDQARRHPGHRRHAAADPRGRQGQGDGHDPDRPHDGRGRGRALRAGRARRAGWRA